MNGQGTAEVTIRNSDGKVVRKLTIDVTDSRYVKIEWDCKDDEGNDVDDGDYTFEVTFTGKWSGETISQAIWAAAGLFPDKVKSAFEDVLNITLETWNLATMIGLMVGTTTENLAKIFKEIYGTAPPGWTGLQYGGIITKPTLGLLGEAGAEAVIPLDRLYSYIPPTIQVEGEGNPIYIYGDIVIESVADVDEFIEELRRRAYVTY